MSKPTRTSRPLGRPKAPKARNPRVVAIGMLRELRATATDLISRWTTTSTVSEHYINQETGRDTHRMVPRPAHMYPENRTEYWADLYDQADAMVQAAARLRDFAADEWRAALERQKP